MRKGRRKGWRGNGQKKVGVVAAEQLAPGAWQTAVARWQMASAAAAVARLGGLHGAPSSWPHLVSQPDTPVSSNHSTLVGRGHQLGAGDCLLRISRRDGPRRTLEPSKTDDVEQQENQADTGGHYAH